MTNNWPLPSPLEDGHGLLRDVDTNAFPHAKQFAACLEELVNKTSDNFSYTPYIAEINGELYEMHTNGNLPHGPSSIHVGTYDHLEMKPEYIGTVTGHLATIPEHFMAFAQVLSGQHVATSDSGYSSEGYVPPIDYAYHHLAFDKGLLDGSPSGNVKECLADYGELNGAMQAVVESTWGGDAKQLALQNLIYLQNFLIYIRGPLRAELGATLVAYAALIESARKQLDGIMAEAVAAMRRLEQGQDVDPVKAVGLLLALAGFVPGLPYAITFGLGVASLAVGAIESEAKKKHDPKDIAVPDDRSHSCVDILRWYLDEARDTCEELSVGIENLTKRLPALLDEVMRTVPADKHIQEELKQLPA